MLVTQTCMSIIINCIYPTHNGLDLDLVVERIEFPNGEVVGDCRQVRAWLDDNGRWRAIADGREILIPDSKIIRDNQPPAPDGNSHLCMSEVGVIFCFVPGQAKI